MTENEIASLIMDSAFLIHRELGPGLLESVYEVVLARQLTDMGLAVERQVPVPIRFKDIIFDEGFRADLFVEQKVIIELESVERLQVVNKCPLRCLTVWTFFKALVASSRETAVAFEVIR